jgi:hypothetical protein
MEGFDRWLRDELGKGRLTLEADAVLSAVARRRLRRRVAGFAGVAVAVLLVATATGAAIRLASAGPFGPAGGSVPTGPPPSLPTLAGARPTEILFTGGGLGYAVLSNCHPSTVVVRCRITVAATEDGGATWAPRPLPPEAARDAVLSEGQVHVYPLGGRRVVVDWPPMTLGSDTGPDRVGTGGRWFSDNAGRTWQARSRSPEGTLSEVPPDGRPLFGEDSPENMDAALQVLRPDGTAARLSPATGGRYGDASVRVGADGSLWIRGVGTDPTTDKSTFVAVSRDRGRSWRTIVVPEFGWPEHVVTVDGHTVYLVALGDATSRLRIQRSTDDGTTWTELNLPSATGAGCHDNLFNIWSGEPGPEGISAVAAVGDGGLILCTPSGVYRLAANSARFTRLTGAPRLIGLVSAGDLAVGITDGFGYQAGDGRAWQPLSFPP